MLPLVILMFLLFSNVLAAVTVTLPSSINQSV